MKQLILATAVLLAFAGRGSAGNAISDGGFEDGTGKWQNLWSSTSGSLSSEYARSGKMSGKREHPETASTGWLRMTTDLDPGVLYRVNAYAYRQTNSISASMSMHTDTPAYSRSASSEKTVKTGEWELLTADIATRHNGTIWIQLGAEGIGSVWFDDVLVTVLKTRDERKNLLLTSVTSQSASNEDKAQAFLDLGEIQYLERNPASAANFYSKVPDLVPDDEARCRQALDAWAKASRRAKDYAAASVALRKLVKDYTPSGTVEEAKHLTKLAWALGEEADHVVPDYKAALKILEEALQIYSNAASVYRGIDPVAHKHAIDLLEDRLVVTRYDINEMKRLGGLK